jgi:hypothetical protein
MATMHTGSSTTILGDRYIPAPTSARPDRPLHLSPTAWDNLALLTPDQHDRLTAEPVGLATFLRGIDEAAVGRTTDLVHWLHHVRADRT